MQVMAPKCPYFSECGGCETQHINYELQLANKKRNLLQIFGDKDILVFSGSEYGYRNRMDFLMQQGPSLRRKGRIDRIVPVRRCEICNEIVNRLLSEVWKWYEELKPQHTAYAVIRASEFYGSSTVSFSCTGDTDAQISRFAAITSAANVVIAEVEHNDSVSSECRAVKGDVVMHELLLGKEFSYNSQGFFQNNPAMAEKMISYVGSILEKYETSRRLLLDLYGGVGTFGLSHASRFKDVIVLESVPESIRCAEANIRRQGIRNARAICLDALAVNRLKLTVPFIITDPPRSGMAPKALERMIAQNAPVIIYVSCNPAQFGKEYRVLCKRYEMKSLALFDLFPQTNHMEIVIELRHR
jgi:23S rRNA (uracil1939-C5)-methyltransferase